MRAIQTWRWAHMQGHWVKQSNIIRLPEEELDARLNDLNIEYSDLTLPRPNIVDVEEEMDITNQINAALNDIRTTLIELTKINPGHGDRVTACNKARYELDLAMDMVLDHRRGKSRPWSERKHQVDEEFS